MENIESLKTLLSSPKKIVITSHRNPDGDAIGSSLGLKHFLKKLDHKITVAFPSEYPDFVSFLPEANYILIHDTNPDFVEKAFDEADIIFALDFNGLSRIDNMGDYIEQHCKEKTKVLIDHHLEPEAFAEFILSDVSASSTCELIYEFIMQLGMEDLVDKTIGTCLFTGILTDTGSFKYSTSPRLYTIAAKLKAIGVDDYALQFELFNSQTEKQMRLLSHCLSNRCMEIFHEYNTGIIVLNKNDYEYFNIQRGDTEGIVNYILRIKNIRFAVLITEQPKIVKLSLRSKGDFSVQELAQKYFKGGGHRNASGGISYLGLRGTVDKFKKILPEYEEQLTKEDETMKLY
jgi:bifunctional oligoribonuclease and PAP phosphatase NrnA